MTITLTREEAQQVLDALLWRSHANSAHNPDFINDAIASLRARLAQPEPDREKLFGVIHLDKDAPLTPEDRKQLRLGLMACLLEDGVLAKLGMLLNRYERTIEHLEAKPEPEQTRSEKMREAGITRRPKGWSKEDEPEPVMLMDAPLLLNGQPLYTAPPQREWQGLTDDEVMLLVKTWHGSLTLASAIEAKLKEKNI